MMENYIETLMTEEAVRTHLILECPFCHHVNQERFIIDSMIECAHCNQLFSTLSKVTNKHISQASDHGFGQFQKFCHKCLKQIAFERYGIRHGQRLCLRCLTNEEIAKAHKNNRNDKGRK
jgi:hypothetical protein